MQVRSYLFFNGNCEEALNFYKEKLGAEITYIRKFKDSPDPSIGPANWQDKIIHATFTLGTDSIMACDGTLQANKSMQGFSLSLGVTNFDKGKKTFDILADGGTVSMPYEKTFWATGFGMLTDKFGVPWMINCA